MTVAQELVRQYSESDMRRENEAEDFVRQKEAEASEQMERNPGILSDFIDLVSTFTNNSKADTEKKLKESSEDQKAVYLREVIMKMLSSAKNAPEDLQKLEQLFANTSPNDLEKAIEQIMGNSKKINLAVTMTIRLLKMFKGGAVISHIMDLEKKFGIEGLNESLSKISPDTAMFLSKLANKKLRTVDYVTLLPILLKIIKRAADLDKSDPDYDPGYLAFTQDINLAEIVDVESLTEPILKNKKKKYQIRAGIGGIDRGTFESDLIIMSITNAQLFEKTTEALAEVLSAKKQGDTAFEIDIKTFNSTKVKIIDLGKRLKERDDELIANQDHIEKVRENGDTSTDVMSQEVISRRLQMVQAQIADIDRQLAPFEKKKIDGTITPEEMQSMYALQQARSSYKYSQNQLEMGVDKSNMESPWNPSEERLMRQVATTFNKKREEIERLAGDPATRSEAQKTDVKMLQLAERFLMNNRNLDVFMKDYYMTTYYEERDAYIAQLHQKAGRQLSPQELHARQQEIDEGAARATRSVTEQMLQNIIIQMYTTTIEAGGEPDMPFANAVSVAKTQLGYNPKMLVNVIGRVLTGYKTMAAQISDSEQMLSTGLFASPDIPHSHEARLKSGENKRAIHQRIDMLFGRSGADIKRFMNSIEREFETFERVIEGSYTLRFQTNLNDGKYYEHLLNEDAMYIRSDTFDITHIMEDGDVASKYLPGLKAIMDDFFAERGWYLVQELERDPLGHDITIFKVFKDYIEQYYPELSENQQRKFAYIAFHQGYSHGYFQQMLSRTRMAGGFVGKVFHRANALHNPHFNAFMFANQKVSAMMDNKHWGRGSRVMPANYRQSDYWDALSDKTGKTESIDHTIPYGAIIQFGTDEFGHFLTYTDKHFEDTEGKGMTPFNIFQTGSDDNYRGWRQINKSIGNVSTNLWDRAPYKDDVKLMSTYTGVDHYTLIWKSVENIGINYVRSWMGELLKIKVDAKGNIAEAAKVEHFVRFLYRRYFAKGIGKELIKGSNDFADTGSEDTFWSTFESLVKKDPSEGSSMMNEILYHAYATMLAERNPLTLINKVTKWTTQTGKTLYDEIRQGDDFKDLNEEEYRQVRRDLLTVQTEARGRVTKQASEKRKEWESGEFDRNIYGDFSQDRSSVSITGKENDRGYVITDDTIEVILREQLSKNHDIPQDEIEKRVANAKKLHKGIMTGFTKKVELPKYEDISKFLSGQALEAYKKTAPFKKLKEKVAARLKAEFAARGEPFDEDTHESVIENEAGKELGKELVRDHLGSTPEEFEAKYGGRLKTHSEWFIDLWKGGYFGMEPENDFAEYFTTYRNPDKDHVWRMAGMSEFTSVAIKKLLDDPDSEKSIETAVKDFAKDPFKAIDKMADYLNPFRKVIENELGKEMAGRYVNYYTLMCIDMALKEDKYRSRSFEGIFNDFVEALTGGTRKQSAATDRYQNFTSKSLTSAEAYKVARYMWEKKLLSPEGFNAMKKRMKATIPDILFEKMPYLAMFFIIALMQQAIIKPTQDELTGKKK